MTVCCLALALGLSGCEPSSSVPVENLPWQITLSPAGNPQVFQVELGKSTLKDLMLNVRSFPEMAVFAHESGKRRLEAYFGTQRLGMFEAKLLAEMQVDEATLTALQTNATKREGMASGYWKHVLAEEDLTVVNASLINRLVYIPSINYDAEIITQRFGTPTERLPSNDVNVEYWFYADKGLAIALNTKGSEVLYYVPIAGFAALKQELLEAKPKND
ncbi:hypothetical protein [Candidatus Thiothrix anitrata]|uniref:Uncharacterized protein n=1 Tax=Candidatus Thiothrix anitrata TaxID=2823902 RepID=A0ABX7X3X8_9GAMM|nr:hypothetical protein [Candidatus Thiothrix anitrata]QTR50587.1 hypothetical protein J8380_03180 [Candidatus Thiothrix anitrata]